MCLMLPVCTVGAVHKSLANTRTVQSSTPKAQTLTQGLLQNRHQGFWCTSQVLLPILGGKRIVVCAEEGGAFVDW